MLHFSVTAHPSAEWTARQIVQAFSWDTAPRYLLRNRGSIYGKLFRECLQGMGVRGVLISHESPWQNPFLERLLGLNGAAQIHRRRSDPARRSENLPYSLLSATRSRQERIG